MKALVTGASGFLGHYLARRLHQDGILLRLLHRPSSDMSALADLPFESAVGDITTSESIMNAVKGVDLVVHAAAAISYSPSEKSKTEEINLGGTKNILEAVKAHSATVKKVIVTSSVVAVGASTRPILLNEDSPFCVGHETQAGDDLIYYWSKKKTEDLVRQYVREHQVPAVLVNPGVIFGAGDGKKSTRRLHLKVAQGKIPFYPGGGVNVVSVHDVVDGHMLAIKNGMPGERYILGGQNITVRELFQWLAEFKGHKPPHIYLPNWIVRAPRLINKVAHALHMSQPISSSDSLYTSTLFHWYDISKAEQQLGYRPKPARQAVVESLTWCDKHHLIS